MCCRRCVVRRTSSSRRMTTMRGYSSASAEMTCSAEPAPDDFARHLDELLTKARGDVERPRTVLMLELPIIPGAWAFAAWQRHFAAKHGVILIPKRVMADVILTEANVVDGLHLSQRGHERMAELLVPWL